MKASILTGNKEQDVRTLLNATINEGNSYLDVDGTRYWLKSYYDAGVSVIELHKYNGGDDLAVFTDCTMEEVLDDIWEIVDEERRVNRVVLMA